MIPFAAFAALVGMMVVELAVSRHNERRLRAEGAIEPAGEVYPVMRVVYPACFAAMAAEGAATGAAAATLASGRRGVMIAGLVVLVTSKALKTWAVASLGRNWSFRVLVKPDHQMVAHGPYRYLRHPNYVAVLGEIGAMALIVAAPVTGVLSLAAMAWLLRKRVAIEERALGLRG